MNCPICQTSVEKLSVYVCRIQDDAGLTENVSIMCPKCKHIFVPFKSAKEAMAKHKRLEAAEALVDLFDRIDARCREHDIFMPTTVDEITGAEHGHLVNWAAALGCDTGTPADGWVGLYEYAKQEIKLFESFVSLKGYTPEFKADLFAGERLTELAKAAGVTIKESFRYKLAKLLDSYNKENNSDMILARYLIGVLEVFDEAVITRDAWNSKAKKAE